jgi:hypothetical protein
MEVSGQLHAAAAFPSRLEPLGTIGEEAGWAPDLDAVKKKNLLTLTGMEPRPPSP